MTKQEAYNALASYLNRPLTTPKGAGTSDIAKFVLLNSQMTKPMGPGAVNGNSPSFLSRLFDILSRPNYAVANLVKDAYRNDANFNPVNSIISGLAGTQKTTFSDVLKDAGMPAVPARGLLGFALDVGLDPTTYIPGAQIGKAGSIFKGLTKGSEAIDKTLPAAEKLLRAGEPINPENFGLPARQGGEIPSALAAPIDIPKLPNPSILESKNGFTTPQQSLDFSATDIGKALAGETGATKPILPNRIQIPEEIRSKLDINDPPVDLGQHVPKQIPFDFKGRDPFSSDPNKLINWKVTDARKTAEAANLTRAQEIVDKVTQGSIPDALKLVPVPHPKISPGHIKIADDIVAKFNPDLATAQINKQFPNTLNAKQQVKLWYKAREAANKRVRKIDPKTKKRRDSAKVESEIIQHAIPIYKAIEDKFIGQGKVPRLGTGENVRLSDIIGDLALRGVPITDKTLSEFATTVSHTSEIGGAIERLRARGAIEDSVKIKNISDIVSDSKAAVNTNIPMSDYHTQNIDKMFKDFAKAAAKKSGVSPAGIKATDKLINMTLDSGKSSAQLAVQRMSKELDQVIATGKANAKVNKTITLALEHSLGKLPAWSVNDNKAVEFLMGRVATWWGQSDLRPMSLVAIASSAATAEARGKVLAKIFEGFDTAQKSEAFRFAQGLGQPSSEATQKLGMDIMRIMDDLTGQAAGSSVLLRSGVNRHQLNNWMRRYGTKFEFTDKIVKSPVTGATQDFSKGSDWVNSWRLANIEEDPASWMFKTMQALESATREKALFDEIGERFGSSVSGREYKTKVEGHPYLEPYYFPSDIAKQLPRVVRDWSLSTTTHNEALKLYDRVLSMWKSGATIYRPAHHIRNMVGDIYMGMLDGVTSVRPYKLALQVQRTMKDSYKTMADVDQMVALGMMPKNIGTPPPGKIIFRNKSGVGFTAEQISSVAHQKGLMEHVRTLEDLIDMGGEQKGLSLMRPFGGKVQQFARGTSELQAHNARLAHFIDKVQKSRGTDLERIFEDASRRSRKFHPSGLDLTHFEKTVMRRIIPFYSWIRKSTPVLLEGMVMKPGISVLPAKLGQGLQEAGGIETEGRDNPFPVDQMLPSWIRNEGIGPIAMPDSWLGKLSNQQPGGYVQAGVGLNPLAALLAQGQDPSKTVGSSITPAIQIPIELITGNKIFTGEPITGVEAKPGAFREYVGNQIPIFNAFQGIAGVGLAGETSKSQKSDNQAGREALVNWLTGMGIKGTGPYVKQALYEKYQPMRVQKAAAKQEFLAQLRDQLGG